MKDQKWIKKHEKLFEGIDSGKIYYVYKGNRVTDKKEYGNKVIAKIAICPECNTKKAGKKIKKPTCHECLRGCRSQKMTNRYYKNKPKSKKRITPKQVWYKGLIPGIIYCVFEGDEVVRLDKVKHLFKPGRKRLSPFTKAEYVGRICICAGKDCGKKRFSRSRVGSLCKKCQDARNTKKCEEKKKVKTAQQIAFSITGKYERVDRGVYYPDVFDGVEREMLQ